MPEGSKPKMRSGVNWGRGIQAIKAHNRPKTRLGCRGRVRSTRGLGLTMTARSQSIGISIGMLPQTLIMSRLDELSRLGARI